jgi:hypothetical protein
MTSGVPSERSHLTTGVHRHRARRGPALGVASVGTRYAVAGRACGLCRQLIGSRAHGKARHARNYYDVIIGSVRQAVSTSRRLAATRRGQGATFTQAARAKMPVYPATSIFLREQIRNDRCPVVAWAHHRLQFGELRFHRAAIARHAVDREARLRPRAGAARAA